MDSNSDELSTRVDELSTRAAVLEDHVARLAAIIQILLESIRAGNAEEVAAKLHDVMAKDFEQR
jgi:uncharacterized small protein (DUF1192 family)